MSGNGDYGTDDSEDSLSVIGWDGDEWDDQEVDPCGYCPHDLSRHRGDGCLDCGCVVTA